MRRRRNLTIVISKDGYTRARIWAARRGISMSAGLALLVESLREMPRIVRLLRAEDPKLVEKFNQRRKKHF